MPSAEEQAMGNVDEYTRYAADLLKARRRRQALFPPELFDEFAWEILLALYIHHRSNVAVDAEEVFDMVGCGPGAGKRWVAFLIDRNQVTRVGEAVALHPSVLAPMEEYLGGMMSDSVTADEEAS